MSDFLRLAIFSGFLAGQAVCGEVPKGTVSMERWLAPQAANAALRNAVEECVSKLGIVSQIQIVPMAQGTSIRVDVHNSTSLVVTGLVLRSDDFRIRAIGLDGAAKIEFEPLLPGETTTYTEVVEGFEDVFSEPTSARAVVLDIYDKNSKRVVHELFSVRYPGLSSVEDLDFVLREFCGMN